MPTFLQELIDRLQSLDRRIVIGVTGVIAVLLIWSISYWATRPEWGDLMPGLDLESVGEVTTRLDEERVPYRLQRGNRDTGQRKGPRTDPCAPRPIGYSKEGPARL